MTSSPSAIRLTLLGGAVLRSNGNPLGGPAAHRHRLALLALLAASPSPVSRDKLIAFLWPERDTEGGRNLLKVAVHELRKLLGDHAIRSTGDQLSLDLAEIQVDLVDLEAGHAAGDDAKVAELYAGPFLDGFHLKDAPEFERWVEAHRSRLASMYAQSLERLATVAEQRCDWRMAAEWWRKVAAIDPLRVDVAMRLMNALSESGDITGAVRHAEIHSAFRERELGVEPDAAVISLAREIASRKTTRASPPPNDVVVSIPTNPQTTAEAVVVAPKHRDRRMALAAIGLAATVIVAAGILLNARGVETAPSPFSLAVVPFRVVGSDTALANGMMEMLVARIGDDGPLRAVEARSSGSARGGEQVAMAIQQGRAAGAAKVLTGDVVGGGGRGDVDVAATIYNVADASIAGRATRTIPRGGSIPATVDTLAAELMARVAGESVDRLPDLTKRPLPALRFYLAAQTAYRTGSYQRSESLFAKALGVDSSFALAGLGLALANSWNTINDHYGLGRDVALRGMKDLGARDRLFIDAFFASDPSLGHPKPAPVYLRAWEEVVHKHPDFAEAWYNVGDRYYHFGGLSGLADPLGQARTAFRRALAVDSGLVAPLHHLIEIYASGGEVAETRETAERYFSSNPGVARDASAIGWTVATVVKDDRWLERLRANFATMPLSDLSRIAWITQSNGWPTADADSALATLERRASATFERHAASTVRYAFALNAGQVARARSAADAFEGQLPEQPIGALWSAYAAMFGDADTVGLGGHLRTLATFGAAPLSGDPDRRSRQIQARCLVAYTKVGTRESASVAVDLSTMRAAATSEPVGSVQRREAEMCVTWLGAAMAVENNAPHADRLVARLDTMVLRDRVPPRMSLAAAAVLAARLHQRRGQLKPALAASRWREHYTGDPIFLSTQLRLEGDIALELGDTVAAVRAYRRYLALRTNPDPGLAADATGAVRRQLAQLERR